MPTLTSSVSGWTVVEGPALHGRQDGLDILVRGDDDHDDVRPEPLHRHQGVDPVHARKADVQEDEIRRMLPYGLYDRLRIGEGPDPVFPAQRPGDPLPDAFIVVHNKNGITVHAAFTFDPRILHR
jgi:hypothetical protein